MIDNERSTYYVVLVKHITVAVTARTASHAAEIAMDQDADQMHHGQWLWAGSEVAAVGTEQ